VTITTEKRHYELLTDFKEDGQYVIIWTYNGKIWSDTVIINAGEFFKYAEGEFVKSNELFNAGQHDMLFVKLDH
jgi:hypothetical protein